MPSECQQRSASGSMEMHVIRKDQMKMLFAPLGTLVDRPVLRASRPLCSVLLVVFITRYQVPFYLDMLCRTIDKHDRGCVSQIVIGSVFNRTV